MARVLITGANGFVGARLAAELVRRGDEVTCLVRTTSRLDRLTGDGFRLAYGDVTDPASLVAPMAEQDYVFHVAGCVKALRPRQMYEVNEEGTRNVIAACAKQPRPPVVVSVSSLAAAGPSPRGRLRMPEDPLCPVSHYGMSKRRGEMAAEQFADRVPITIVRPAIVFGEWDPVSFGFFASRPVRVFTPCPAICPTGSRSFTLTTWWRSCFGQQSGAGVCRLRAAVARHLARRATISPPARNTPPTINSAA